MNEKYVPKITPVVGSVTREKAMEIMEKGTISKPENPQPTTITQEIKNTIKILRKLLYFSSEYLWVVLSYSSHRIPSRTSIKDPDIKLINP